MLKEPSYVEGDCFKIVYAQGGSIFCPDKDNKDKILVLGGKESGTDSKFNFYRTSMKRVYDLDNVLKEIPFFSHEVEARIISKNGLENLLFFDLIKTDRPIIPQQHDISILNLDEDIF